MKFHSSFNWRKISPECDGYEFLSCPTTSVYAIYNRLPADIRKTITAYPCGVHGRCPQKNGNAALEEVIRRCRLQN